MRQIGNIPTRLYGMPIRTTKTLSDQARQVCVFATDVNIPRPSVASLTIAPYPINRFPIPTIRYTINIHLRLVNTRQILAGRPGAFSVIHCLTIPPPALPLWRPLS